MNRRKKLLIFLSFMFGMCTFSITSGRTYAMETMGSKIQNAMEESNPEQYEMNIILWDLDIKFWYGPSSAWDEAEQPVDEPLGKYSPEELRKYTDRDVNVEIDYGYGRLWEGEKSNFFQVIRIYENKELVSCSYISWEDGYVEWHGGRLKEDRVKQ